MTASLEVSLNHLYMKNKPLRSDLEEYISKHNIAQKFAKQYKLLESNHRHPSLHVERLEPKHLKLYSFRIDRQYRAIFIITERHFEVVDINNHYH